MGKRLADYQREAREYTEITGEETIAQLKEIIAQGEAETLLDDADLDQLPEEIPESILEVPETEEETFDMEVPDQTEETVPPPETTTPTKQPAKKMCKGLFIKIDNTPENFPCGGNYSRLYYTQRGLEIPGEEK